MDSSLSSVLAAWGFSRGGIPSEESLVDATALIRPSKNKAGKETSVQKFSAGFGANQDRV
jgi:hypothetical protein